MNTKSILYSFTAGFVLLGFSTIKTETLLEKVNKLIEKHNISASTFNKSITQRSPTAQKAEQELKSQANQMRDVDVTLINYIDVKNQLTLSKCAAGIATIYMELKAILELLKEIVQPKKAPPKKL